jgi:hypothetical protein
MKLSDIEVGGVYTFERRAAAAKAMHFPALVVSKTGYRGGVMALVRFRDRHAHCWVERMKLGCCNLKEPLEGNADFDAGIEAIHQYIADREKMVEPVGVEPTTLCVQGRYSTN